MTEREIQQLRNANACMVNDLNVMQQRCAEFERLLKNLQGELQKLRTVSGLVDFKPLDVDALPTQTDEELELERGGGEG